MKKQSLSSSKSGSSKKSGALSISATCTACAPHEGENAAWEYVSADRKQVVLVYCTIRAHVLTGLTQLRFEGLSEKAQYRNTETGEVYGGDFLMNAGLYLPDDRDYESKILIFEQCSSATIEKSSKKS